MFQDDLVKPEVQVVHRILVFNVGVGTQAKCALRVLVEAIIAYETERVIVGPYFGLNGEGKLFILRVANVGGDC
jgi:hypothetical protein